MCSTSTNANSLDILTSTLERDANAISISTSLPSAAESKDDLNSRLCMYKSLSPTTQHDHDHSFSAHGCTSHTEPGHTALDQPHAIPDAAVWRTITAQPPVRTRQDITKQRERCITAPGARTTLPLTERERAAKFPHSARGRRQSARQHGVPRRRRKRRAVVPPGTALLDAAPDTYMCRRSRGTRARGCGRVAWT
ncbi:hypothetical protein AcV5_003753 [Taiwanofungus camphoratus]|nr:hypothetical protein AcV5_003753 [Antrodia cinnamomea]